MGNRNYPENQARELRIVWSFVNPTDGETKRINLGSKFLAKNRNFGYYIQWRQRCKKVYLQSPYYLTYFGIMNRKWAEQNYYYCQTYFVAISHFQNLTRILVQTHRCCRRCLKKNLSLNTCVLSIPTSNCLPKFECPIGPFSDKLRLVNLGALRRLVAEEGT